MHVSSFLALSSCEVLPFILRYHCTTMGCTGSKSLDNGNHESSTRAALVWPTAGTCPAEVLENVNYIRHDFERWFSHISCKDLEETNLNEVVVCFFSSL